MFANRRARFGPRSAGWASATGAAAALILVAAATARGATPATAPATTQPRSTPAARPGAEFSSFAGGDEARGADGFYVYVKLGPAGQPAEQIILSDFYPAAARAVNGEPAFEFVTQTGARFDYGVTRHMMAQFHQLPAGRLRHTMGRTIALSENPVAAYRAALVKNPGLSLKQFLTESKEMGPLMEIFDDTGDHHAARPRPAGDGHPMSLVEAIRGGTAEDLRAALGKGADVNEVDASGQTPLIWALREGKADLVKLLLDAKADPDLADRTAGQTPLVWALHAEKTDLMKLLLDAKADPNLADRSGLTPLDWAVRGKKPNMVKLLQDAKAQRDKADK